MRRSLSIIAVAAAAALGSPVVTTGGADAAPPTCRGERATIVGKPGRGVVGTDGRDVIVSNGSTRIRSGKGHDLICLRGARYNPFVESGPGDDVVWVERTRGRVWAELGAGADEFHGSARDLPDTVFGDGFGDGDTDRDVILTGGGRDSVSVGTSRRLLADRVDLGTGRNEYLRVFARGLTAGNVLRGSPGATLSIDGNVTGSWWIDNQDRVIRRGDQMRFRYTGFDRFYSIGGQTMFYGTDRDESFSTGVGGTALLGGGDDEVRVHGAEGRSPLIRGGPGFDRITLSNASGAPIRASLAHGNNSTIGDRVVNFLHFERLEGYATGRVALSGSKGDDELAGQACPIVIHGGAGNDRIYGPYDTNFLDGELCDRRTIMNGGSGSDRINGSWGDVIIDGGSGADRLSSGARDALEVLGGLGNDRIEGSRYRLLSDVLRGGPGNDDLLGYAGDDELYGDDGTDTAVGGAGDDLCSAETTRQCERD